MRIKESKIYFLWFLICCEIFTHIAVKSFSVACLCSNFYVNLLVPDSHNWSNMCIFFHDILLYSCVLRIYKISDTGHSHIHIDVGPLINYLKYSRIARVNYGSKILGWVKQLDFIVLCHSMSFHFKQLLMLKVM